MTGVYPLYAEHAAVWPLVAPLESYREEMAVWVEILKGSLAGELDLLDLGSGGGHHLYQLLEQWPDSWRAVAVDQSAAMLGGLRSLLPEVETVQADMTTFSSARRFSAITVHDSFCYLTSADQVRALWQVMAGHSLPGAVALVKLEAVAEEFAGPYRYLTTYEQQDREITLTHYEWDPDPTDHQLEVIYHFLDRQGQRVSSREERHRLGLFSRRELVEWAEQAGWTTRWHELERWDEERPNLLLELHRAEVESAPSGKVVPR